MLMSTLIYAYVAFSVLKAEPRETDTMVMALTGIAAVILVLSFVIPRILLKAGLPSIEPEILEEVDPTHETVFRDAPRTTRLFKDPLQVMNDAYPVVFTPMILRFALSEAIAVIGIVTASMGYPKSISAAFIAGGFVRLVFAVPTIRDDIIKPVETHYDATFSAEQVGQPSAEATEA